MIANMEKSTPNKPLVNYVPREKTRLRVSFLSRGNLSLQRGAYCTESDMKKKRERVATYDFSKF